jgi:hypothetical protein
VSNLNDMTHVRAAAALAANADDAAIWRWFAPLLEERRIRWCCSGDRWLVSVNNRHVATDSSFDKAIRIAKDNVEGLTRPSRSKRTA